MERFLSQPFFVAEPFNKRPGSYVSRADAVRDYLVSRGISASRSAAAKLIADLNRSLLSLARASARTS